LFFIYLQQSDGAGHVIPVIVERQTAGISNRFQGGQMNDAVESILKKTKEQMKIGSFKLMKETFQATHQFENLVKGLGVTDIDIVEVDCLARQLFHTLQAHRFLLVASCCARKNSN
jgi:hypothetical protein